MRTCGTYWRRMGGCSIGIQPAATHLREGGRGGDHHVPRPPGEGATCLREDGMQETQPRSTMMCMAKSLAISYPFWVTPDDGQYVVEVFDLPGCMTVARRLEDVGPMAADAAAAWIRRAEALGREIPRPSEAFPGVSPDEGSARSRRAIPLRSIESPSPAYRAPAEPGSCGEPAPGASPRRLRQA
jgi:predicted RNase H-like HicB family nuclease